MIKVTSFLLMIFIFFSVSAFTQKTSDSLFQPVAGLAPVSKPLSGAKIFHSMPELHSWRMAKTAADKNSGSFDFRGNALLAVWLGKSEANVCISIENIEISADHVLVTASAVNCSEKWSTSYMYYRVPAGAVSAELKLK